MLLATRKFHYSFVPCGIPNRCFIYGNNKHRVSQLSMTSGAWVIRFNKGSNFKLMNNWWASVIHNVQLIHSRKLANFKCIKLSS